MLKVVPMRLASLLQALILYVLTPCLNVLQQYYECREESDMFDTVRWITYVPRVYEVDIDQPLCSES